MYCIVSIKFAAQNPESIVPCTVYQVQMQTPKHSRILKRKATPSASTLEVADVKCVRKDDDSPWIGLDAEVVLGRMAVHVYSTSPWLNELAFGHKTRQKLESESIALVLGQVRKLWHQKMKASQAAADQKIVNAAQKVALPSDSEEDAASDDGKVTATSTSLGQHWATIQLNDQEMLVCPLKKTIAILADAPSISAFVKTCQQERREFFASKTCSSPLTPMSAVGTSSSILDEDSQTQDDKPLLLLSNIDDGRIEWNKAKQCYVVTYLPYGKDRKVWRRISKTCDEDVEWESTVLKARRAWNNLDFSGASRYDLPSVPVAEESESQPLQDVEDDNE